MLSSTNIDCKSKRMSRVYRMHSSCCTRLDADDQQLNAWFCEHCPLSSERERERESNACKKSRTAELLTCLWQASHCVACHVLAGVIAQLSLSEGSQQEGLPGEGATPTMHMEVDWDLGVSGHSDDLPEEEEV